MEVPLNKPLRRGGPVLNPKGEEYRVAFRYERLVGWCFSCGQISHTHSDCPILRSAANGEKPYGEWIKAGTQVRITQPSKDQYHAHRTHKPSSVAPPNFETEMPNKTDTKKSAIQTKINASPSFANPNSSLINSITTSDLLPQLDKFKKAAISNPPKHKTNPIFTPPHTTCLTTILTTPHKTDPTCLNTTITPLQQQVPTVTKLKTHQPQTVINNTKNHGTHLFSVPISYDENQTLHQTLVPLSRDQPSRDKLNDPKPIT